MLNQHHNICSFVGAQIIIWASFPSKEVELVAELDIAKSLFVILLLYFQESDLEHPAMTMII